MSLQSNVTNGGRKGSLSLGNGNNSQAKTKQQKIIDCIDLSDDQPLKKPVKDKKFTNGSGNSNKTHEKNGNNKPEKTEEKIEKAPVVKKTVDVQPEKKKVEEKEKAKPKRTASSDAPVRKEEKPKPSTPTLNEKKKVTKPVESPQPVESPKPVEKIDSSEKTPVVEVKEKEVEQQPTSTEKPKPSPAKKKEPVVQQDDEKTAEVSTTTNSQPVPEPSPKKEVQKKQTPEPVMFAEKDHLVSSTPAKPAPEGLVNHKQISKSSDNVTAVSLAEVKTYPLDRSSCPTSYRNISGRRSLRPMKDYVFQHTNSSLRESYRKINTELDVGNISNNTSLNVTVGSEVPSNWSFSFLGRSRKRDRTPTHMDTSETGVNEMDTSPTSPKRARFDFSGFVGILSSPVTMLRERLARAKIQTTPHKIRTSEEDVTEVANLSSVSVEDEEKPTEPQQNDEIQIDVDIEALKEQDKEENKENEKDEQPSIGEDPLDADEGESEVRETEVKKKGCVVM